MGMKKAIIIANANKRVGHSLAKEVKAFLEKSLYTADVILTSSEEFSTPNINYSPDIVISIGGDGTMLSVVYKFHAVDVPIFAINAGDLGFITPFSLTDWKSGLRDFVEGRAIIKNKILLDATIIDKSGNEKSNGVALNEISVQRSETNHLLRLDAYLGSECFANGLPADGAIIATPTGSTAYSMSAGGSVLEDDADVFIFTPNSPFMAIDRGIVFSGKSVVTIRVCKEQKASRASVNADGAHIGDLEKSDRLVVKKSKYCCSVVMNPNLSDIARIGEKLMWKRLGE